jgi:hypothetical protein
MLVVVPGVLALSVRVTQPAPLNGQLVGRTHEPMCVGQHLARRSEIRRVTQCVNPSPRGLRYSGRQWGVVVRCLGDRVQHGVKGAGDIGIAVVGRVLGQDGSGGGRSAPAGASALWSWRRCLRRGWPRCARVRAVGPPAGQWRSRRGGRSSSSCCGLGSRRNLWRTGGRRQSCGRASPGGPRVRP